MLTAPASGKYQGINFFQDRTLTNRLTLKGQNNTAISGTVYAPSASVTLIGNGITGYDTLGGGIIANSLTIEGLGNIQVSSTFNRPKVPEVFLVE